MAQTRDAHLMPDGFLSKDWQTRGDWLVSTKPSAISDAQWEALFQDDSVFVRRSAILKKLKTSDSLSLDDWVAVLAHQDEYFSSIMIQHVPPYIINTEFFEMICKKRGGVSIGMSKILIEKFLRAFYQAQPSYTYANLPKIIPRWLTEPCPSFNKFLFVDYAELPLFDFTPTVEEEALIASHRNAVIPAQIIKKWADERSKIECVSLKDGLAESKRIRAAL